MNISFYTAAVGAQQQQERLDVHGNNIANVNTYGFKDKRPSFAALMTGPVRGIDEDLPRGVGSRMVGAETDLSTSGFADTGRRLDYAIEGSGFFALVDPGSGAISYTRDGSFTRSHYPIADTDPDTGEQTVSDRWYLSDGRGRFVLGTDGGPILVPDEMEQAPLGAFELPIGVFDFINRSGIQSVGDNRFQPVDKNGQVMLGDGKVVQGLLEASGTDLAYELSKVIESQRSFSYMLRMVTTSDEIETTVNNLRT